MTSRLWEIPALSLGILFYFAAVCHADFRITSDVNNSIEPGVAVGSDQFSRVVWSDNRGGGYDIWWALVDPGGNVVIRVNVSDSEVDSNTPRISLDDQNRSFVVWKEEFGASTNIYFSRIGNSGAIEIPPKKINTNVSCVDPDIETTSNGTSHVVYEMRSAVFRTRYLVLDSDGAVLQDNTPGDWDVMGLRKYPSVGLSPSGNVFVTWADIDFFFSEGLYSAEYTAGGSGGSAQKIYNGNSNSWTTTTVPSSGQVWRFFQKRVSGVDKIYRWTGQNSAVQISPDSDPAVTPRTVGVEGHEVYVVWEHSQPGSSVIMAKGWVAGSGAEIPGYITVSDGPQGATASKPDVSSDINGHFRVVWQDSRNGNSEIYLDAIDPLIVRVTAEVRPGHIDDPFLDPSPPLPGVLVRLIQQGSEWTNCTDEEGFASFAVPEIQSGDYYELELSGEVYHLRTSFNEESALQTVDPINHRESVPVDGSPLEYEWPAGEAVYESPALQAAYFICRFKIGYLHDRFGYEWTLPTQLGHDNNRVFIWIFEHNNALAKAGGGSAFKDTLFFLHEKSQESSVVYHEFTHSVIADRCLTFGRNDSDPPRIGTALNPESEAIDEALADYFAASFANDPVIDPCHHHWGLICIKLRDLTRTMKYPTNGFAHDHHDGSLILSGALWELRELIDGPGAAVAQNTDPLVFGAIDTLLSRGFSPGETAFTFDNFYDAIKSADVEGIYAGEIDAAFGSHNLGNLQQPFEPQAIGNPFTQVNEFLDSIEFRWNRIPGVTEFQCYVKAVDLWPGGTGLGEGYVLLEENLADTVYVLQNRDEHTEYLFAVAPIDGNGDEGLKSEPVFVEAKIPSGVKTESANVVSTGKGRWLFNSPNPFNPSTTLVFEVEERGAVDISIYDVSGSLVTHLVTEIFPMGRHSVQWNGTNENGNQAPSGVYFAVLQGRDWRASAKILLLK